MVPKTIQTYMASRSLIPCRIWNSLGVLSLTCQWHTLPVDLLAAGNKPSQVQSLTSQTQSRTLRLGRKHLHSCTFFKWKLSPCCPSPRHSAKFTKKHHPRTEETPASPGTPFGGEENDATRRPDLPHEALQKLGLNESKRVERYY